MSASLPETLNDAKSFDDAMVKLHTLIHLAQMKWLQGDTSLDVQIDNRVLEYVRNMVGCMTNIDTPAKEAVFSDLCSVYPKFDYATIASDLR